MLSQDACRTMGHFDDSKFQRQHLVWKAGNSAYIYVHNVKQLLTKNDEVVLF